jgi:hypothetical protein
MSQRPPGVKYRDQAPPSGSEGVTQALQLQPTRSALDSAVPADPTIYRFYEVLQVYGPTVKELIHEQFGDGIMSAINFRRDVRREPDPGGDRVIVTLDGKFPPTSGEDGQTAARTMTIRPIQPCPGHERMVY